MSSPSDATAARTASPAGDTNRKDSVAAVVTFILLAIWALIIVWILILVSNGVEIEGATLGVLAGVIGTHTTFTSVAVGFWLASSIGAKSSGDALAQLAGAGPPSPAVPLSSPVATAAPPALAVAPAPAIEPLATPPGGDREMP